MRIFVEKIELLEMLLGGLAFTVEPGVSPAPVKTWEKDPESGKSRPTGPQERYQGLPLWSLSVRVLEFHYGTLRRADAEFIIAAPEMPDLNALGEEVLDI